MLTLIQDGDVLYSPEDVDYMQTGAESRGRTRVAAWLSNILENHTGLSLMDENTEEAFWENDAAATAKTIAIPYSRMMVNALAIAREAGVLADDMETAAQNVDAEVAKRLYGGIMNAIDAAPPARPRLVLVK